MEVLVLGGHVIDGLNKKETAPPGLATCSRIEMVVGGHFHEFMYVCMYVRMFVCMYVCMYVFMYLCK